MAVTTRETTVPTTQAPPAREIERRHTGIAAVSVRALCIDVSSMFDQQLHGLHWRKIGACCVGERGVTDAIGCVHYGAVIDQHRGVFAHLPRPPR